MKKKNGEQPPLIINPPQSPAISISSASSIISISSTSPISVHSSSSESTVLNDEWLDDISNLEIFLKNEVKERAVDASVDAVNWDSDTSSQNYNTSLIPTTLLTKRRLDGSIDSSDDNRDHRNYIEPGEISNHNNLTTSHEKCVAFADHHQCSCIGIGKLFNAVQNVRIEGIRAPKPIDSFQSMDLHTILLDALTSKMKCIEPTTVQQYAVPVIMAKRDSVICAQTGSGKTLAYLLPIINVILKCSTQKLVQPGVAEPIAIILAPTVDLTNQIHHCANCLIDQTDVRCCVLKNGINAKNNNCHIMISTIDRLNTNRSSISFENIQFIVLDEADRMLARSDKDQLQTIILDESMPAHPKRNVIMVSATMPYDQLLSTNMYLQKQIVITVGDAGAACGDVEQLFYDISIESDKRNKLVELIKSSDPNDGHIIFVDERQKANDLAAFLCRQNLDSIPIHAGLSERERTTSWNEVKLGKRRIVVATGIASRGLDIKHVAHVVNYELPQDIYEYINRIGRTGRVGHKGRSTSFFNKEMDGNLATELADCLRKVRQPVPTFLKDYERLATN